jgi:hypothetical protein
MACGRRLLRSFSIGYITRAVLAVPEAVSSLLTLVARVEQPLSDSVKRRRDGDIAYEDMSHS